MLIAKKIQKHSLVWYTDSSGDTGYGIVWAIMRPADLKKLTGEMSYAFQCDRPFPQLSLRDLKTRKDYRMYEGEKGCKLKFLRPAVQSELDVIMGGNKLGRVVLTPQGHSIKIFG